MDAHFGFLTVSVQLQSVDAAFRPSQTTSWHCILSTDANSLLRKIFFTHLNAMFTRTL